MVETDWREIINISQRELSESDKETLCESVSWMEADDIELNFSDLKTLFRLAQDLLKFKNEQVNNLRGELQTQKKSGKKKKSKSSDDSSPKIDATSMDVIAQQDEIINTNKDIIKQLYEDIAQLEDRKSKLLADANADKESDSSRDALSEINAIEQLENQVAMKNKHIRKLIGDVKNLEEENMEFKEKMFDLNEKLTEATQIIESLTEQLLEIKTEKNNLKELLGKIQEERSGVSLDIDVLKTKISELERERNSACEDLQVKVQHWKNIAKLKKAENETLSTENDTLKRELDHIQKTMSSPKGDQRRFSINKLQEKLTEATNEIIQSAKLIENLRQENRQLKNAIKDKYVEPLMTETKNESDDGKQRSLIRKLRHEVSTLALSLKAAEQMVENRERELTEVSAQLLMVQSGEEGIANLIESLKEKKKQVKQKDEGIKSLVKEVNKLNEYVDSLQMENETLRVQLNITPNEKVPITGTLKKYRNMERGLIQSKKKNIEMEEKLTELELDNYNKKSIISNISEALRNDGYNMDKLNELFNANKTKDVNVVKPVNEIENESTKQEMEAIIEENAGLRKGLQEILEYLKDNSTTTSGILALECPSLESVIRFMEARHTSGWFSPHMAVMMELKSALAGRDALLTALHEARKETFDVMSQLSKESEKTRALTEELKRVDTKPQSSTQIGDVNIFNDSELDSWVFEEKQNEIDVTQLDEVERVASKADTCEINKLKHVLVYFHQKFVSLFDQITKMSIQMSDEQNKWFLQEEQYKAEIEQMKSALQNKADDDISEDSPGLVDITYDSKTMHRKLVFLEESYKYIRTHHENMRNEYLECKKELITVKSDYEIKIQKMLLSVTNVTDKLRRSVPLKLILNQYNSLDDIITKYRVLLNKDVTNDITNNTLQYVLEQDRLNLMASFNRLLSDHKDSKQRQILSETEINVLQNQIERLCSVLEEKDQTIRKLELINLQLQEDQSKIINDIVAGGTNKEESLQETIISLENENKSLKENIADITTKLDVTKIELEEMQQCQINRDLEVNMLRHQVLDLQSDGDMKAALARLSGEVLVAHLQNTESQKKMKCLVADLSKEMEKRVESEEMLKTREKIFNVYAQKYQFKFKYLTEILQILKRQYLGSLPLTSLETYRNNIEDISRMTKAAQDKLDEIEDLRSDLMIKHNAYDKVLEQSRADCQNDEENCPHRLKLIFSQSANNREKQHLNEKINNLEKSRDTLTKHCNFLETTILNMNQVFEKSKFDEVHSLIKNFDENNDVPHLELEDVHSEDESGSRRSQTISLPNPQVLKSRKDSLDMTLILKENLKQDLPGSPIKHQVTNYTNTVNVLVQTTTECRKDKSIQTLRDKVVSSSKNAIEEIANLQKNLDTLKNDLKDALNIARRKSEENFILNNEKLSLEADINDLKHTIEEKNRSAEHFERIITDLNHKLEASHQLLNRERTKVDSYTEKEKLTLLEALKKLEEDKNAIVNDYKQVLQKERDDFSGTIRDMNTKLLELQNQLDSKRSDSINGDVIKSVHHKYSIRIVELEDECFQLRSELDGLKRETSSNQSECERWKQLAAERLAKMEQLTTQLEERHNEEVQSYKAENEHWMSQLNENQRSYLEMKHNMAEQKASFNKQISDKDTHIENLRSTVQSLKTQIMSMQTVMSANDPGFDLSAIVEVEADSDGSQQPTDRLEIRFDSTTDVNDDLIPRLPCTNTTIWQEPLIDRLRREKQLTGKQNAMLRRQVKALAARERRARLEAQNLKSQVYRISTSGTKVVTSDAVSLQAKITSLQAQLVTARRDTHNSVALWDKWKRAQQSSERWQAKFEEKCREVIKLESSLNLTKSSLNRLEKEKRILLNRLSEINTEEKQERVLGNVRCPSPESPAYRGRGGGGDAEREGPDVPRALLERLQAQQRRIAALELADKGNESLVLEYERSLAEVTALKGQVLKLESTLLETQIRSPVTPDRDPQPELEYWKNYCDMLKEENIQLTMKLSTLESGGGGSGGSSAGHAASRQRISDLEQTVLTLRGLVNKLQSDNKQSSLHKKPDSRPNSSRVVVDKNHGQLESYRIEIANLKRSILDKDNLLERSKEMLKIAAEREEELLRENTYLRQQLEEASRWKEGFLSA